MVRRAAAVLLALTSVVLAATPSSAAPTAYEFRIAYATPVTSWGVVYTYAHQGTKATFKGTILPRAVKSVRLQESVDGGRTWKTVVATKTDSAGRATATFAPVSSRDYSWALVPDSSTASTRSASVRVTVFAKLTAYPNCAELNKRYPHGVGKPNAKDKKTSGTPVMTFLPDATEYALNDGGKGQHDLDRDNDGIACEKA